MHVHPSRWLVAGVCLLAPAAMAGSSEPVAHGVSVGVSSFQQLGLWRNAEPAMTLDAAYHRALGTQGPARHLFLGGGLRYALPSANTTFPLELYARAELRTRVGIWEPAGGFEVGFSRVSLPRQAVRLPMGVELYEQNDALVSGPLYFAIHAAPLRFHVGRVILGGPELQWGPAGPPFRTAQRLHLGLARVEVKL